MQREKTKIKYKIKLFYDSKLKYNVIERKARRKTRILTRDSARIDPIDCRIKGFSFREFKDDRRDRRIDFSLFSP